jgi:secretion/DNA translocation related TadE-like protein
VLAVAAVGTLLICLVGGLTVVAAVHAAHTARAAADLAALSAAAAVQQGASAQAACARAGQVAASNDGVLRACAADAGGRVTVEVVTVVQPPLPALALGSARARARAGTVL